MTSPIDFLLDADPAIRWQTIRDLLDAPEAEWRAEQRRTLTEGWGARLLNLQDPAQTWGGGIYLPKWTSTTYTLLSLIDIGIPADSAAARQGAQLMMGSMLGETCDQAFMQKLATCDRCLVGMNLEIGAYFGIQDERIPAIIDNLLSERMPDQGWNCRRIRPPLPHHSSFHTTINVLEGLRTYLEVGGTYRRDEILAAEQGALNLLLEHHLYQSDKTGEVINPKFTLLSFPYYWRYYVLRGLEYFSRINAPHDPRLQDAIHLLCQKQQPDGCWRLEYRHPAKVFFQMEAVGKPSRWVTLKALKVLNWWGIN